MNTAEGLARLDPAHAAYLQGGAGDEITLRANRQAWQDLPLWPRSLRPLAGSHTRIELLGRTWPSPLLVAPMAHQMLAHPQGEQGTALAAAALGVGMVLGCQASQRLEDVARPVAIDTSRGPLWFQLYLQPRREDTLALVRRAEAAGFEALVLTVDAPVQGVRDRELQAGFRLPPGLTAVNLPPPTPESLDALLARAATADDIVRIHRAGKIASLFGIEGGYSIDDSLGLLRQFHAAGVRYTGSALREHVRSVIRRSSLHTLVYEDRPRVDGDTVFLRYRETVRAPDGNEWLSFSACDCVRVQDGLIVAIHEYAILQQRSPERRPRTGRPADRRRSRGAGDRDRLARADRQVHRVVGRGPLRPRAGAVDTRARQGCLCRLAGMGDA